MGTQIQYYHTIIKVSLYVLQLQSRPIRMEVLLNGLPKVFTEVATATWTTILLNRNKYKELRSVGDEMSPVHILIQAFAKLY